MLAMAGRDLLGAHPRFDAVLGLSGRFLALGAALVLFAAPTAFGAPGRSEAFRFRAHASGLAAKVLLYIDRRRPAPHVVVGLSPQHRRPSRRRRSSKGSLSSPRLGA